MKNYNFEWRILELLNKSKHVADTIRIFLQELSAESGVEAGSVWLLDDQDHINLYAACGDNCGGLQEIVLQRGQGICGQCIETNEVILVEDVSKDKRWFRKADEKTGFHTQSILAIPISSAQASCFGCLQLLNKTKGKFEPEDIELAKIMAMLLAKWFHESGVVIPTLKKKEVLLEGKNLRKTYGQGDAAVHALNNVSFKIHRGELTVILGSSGSGKSTLLNMIGGMATPDEGEIIFANKGNICAFNKRQQTDYRKDCVGFIFQFYNLIPELNVEENISLAADMAVNPRPIQEVIDMMGIGHRTKHYPSQMSGGEQQRVSIARALVKNADFLLGDEPTGALDFNTGRQLLIEIERLVREFGQTVVIVTHTVSIASIADRILKMRSGKIVEEIVNPHPTAAADVEW
jgi:putative ABC transport system ATP-binding protein